MVLEFLPEARVEAIEATSYNEAEAREPGLGARFRSELESVASAILQHPLLWRERRGGFRRVNFAGFPYYVAYFLRSERLVIAAVAHASRHPDYWKRRVP